MELLKRKRAIAKGKFTRKVTLLDEGVREGEPVSVLKNNYEQISEAFQHLEDSNDVILKYVCDNKLEDKLVKEAEEYMIDCERIMKKRLTEISSIENIQNSVKPKVKIKAFEPPKFDGNLREYPRFKEDFKNLVKSVYGEDAYALKMCLSGDALQTVRGAEDGECRDALDLMSVGVLVGPPCYRQSCEDALDWMIVGVTCQVCYGDSKSVSVGH
ncbi:uncharacterized protein LOC135110848 isoform X1 [Scylla paramamosain]